MTEATMKTSVPYFFAVKGQWTIRQNVENKSILNPFHLIETPWRQFVLLFLEVMRFCYLPVLAVGNLLEFVLNVMLANGGIINTLLKVTFPCTGKLVVRCRDDENFATLLSIMDRRWSLKAQTPENRTGSRDIADILVMASKLAYENAAYNLRVVSTIWKMNFVGFYDCWNEYFKVAGTQVLLFTDKSENANAIVVAFRGTEPFNMLDWSTDVDFSWFELEDAGRVHVGFWEALGLGDREKIMQLSSGTNAAPLKEKHSVESREDSDDQEKLKAYSYLTSKVKTLMYENPEAKLYVTGHSLGGALAALYTTALFYYNETMVTDRLGALYTFGQPRVGDRKLSKYMESKIDEAKYVRVVYTNDMVPRLPFDDSAFKFKHACMCYYVNSFYHGKTMEDAPFPNFFSIRFFFRFITMRLTALQELILSTFLWLFVGRDYKETIESTLFRAMGLIVPGISDHGLTNYINIVRLGRLHSDSKY
ncbi:hypothetical protein MPTK1_8g16740 [Marchantia polymorpha subsp. ruderalis]|uniref:Fungal lipase-type domain-containing protein n=1 Tax=Marchantia polymorpha TaxID=3197 RepID=A0A2R6X838_MARPO|nr:hypothetical protein MARPO_0030s0007 [Marchantia polymorpha]BBN20139.1 hypothetical protein Mp_8g16740 [Marchantia polymorpha subsp. ruderalis]|eukprot:PTQ42253.1 hypothetical protein MARPO_0030s0007 [Marchantia polymorpha]